LYDGEDIAHCPSCTLRIRVIFDEENLPELNEDDQLSPPNSTDVKVQPSLSTPSTPPSSANTKINPSFESNFVKMLEILDQDEKEITLGMCFNMNNVDFKLILTEFFNIAGANPSQTPDNVASKRDSLAQHMDKMQSPLPSLSE
jgi:hypothetical protein